MHLCIAIPGPYRDLCLATCVSRYVSRSHKRYVNACIAILQVQILSNYYVKRNICIWTTKQFTARWIHNINKYLVLPCTHFYHPREWRWESPHNCTGTWTQRRFVKLELQLMTRFYRHYLKYPRHAVGRLFSVCLNWVVLMVCKVRIKLRYYWESSPSVRWRLHRSTASASINNRLFQFCGNTILGNTVWSSPCCWIRGGQ